MLFPPSLLGKVYKRGKNHGHGSSLVFAGFGSSHLSGFLDKLTGSTGILSLFLINLSSAICWHQRQYSIEIKHYYCFYYSKIIMLLVMKLVLVLQEKSKKHDGRYDFMK